LLKFDFLTGEHQHARVDAQRLGLLAAQKGNTQHGPPHSTIIN